MTSPNVTTGGTCRMCGATLPPHETPIDPYAWVYCDRDCQDLERYLLTTDSIIEHIADRFTGTHAQSIQRQLWAMANSLKPSGRKAGK